MKRTVVTEGVPGPRTKELAARGAFDMQGIYRTLVIDDVKSLGPYIVDVDGNILLDLFANFALGALGYESSLPRIVERLKGSSLEILFEFLEERRWEVGEHICRLTAYCCDKPAYLAARRELGTIWRRRMGSHYPAMSMIFVSDLLDHPAKIELEATAVLPACR